MTGNKTKYTPTEAINAIEGMHRKRFYEMMKNGDITFEEDDSPGKKGRLIDASELVRVFGENFKIDETPETPDGNTLKHFETPGNTNGNTGLGIQDQVKLEVSREKISMLETKIDEQGYLIDDLKNDKADLSKKLDKAQETLNNQTKLLEARKEDVEANENLAATPIAGTPKEAIRGKNFAALGVFFLLGVALLGGGTFFWFQLQEKQKELEAKTAEVEKLKLIEPASGTETVGQGTSTFEFEKEDYEHDPNWLDDVQGLLPPQSPLTPQEIMGSDSEVIQE